MPRSARIVVPGWPHHISQRGNNRQDVFFTDQDREFYLNTLNKQSRKYALSLLGYCLMTNHLHIIAIPVNPDSLQKAIGLTNLIYAQYVNRLHGRSGHLWQNRFYSCILDEVHLVMAMAYIERNPVRAKMVKRAGDYQWSSAKIHLGRDNATGFLDLKKWSELTARMDWLNLLAREEGEDNLKKMRLHTSRGRPLASDNLISKLESKLGKRLRPLPHGRPINK